MVWLDHRATEQASRINALGSPALKTVGGVISPEMEMPKLLWLKENFPDKWLLEEGNSNGQEPPPSRSDSGEKEKRFSRFFDLADFLVFRSTGQDQRSLCTTVCKWNYDALSSNAGDDSKKEETEKGGFVAGSGSSGEGRWDRSFLEAIGLGDLDERHIGGKVSAVGEPVAGGLTAAAAKELGLGEVSELISELVS